MMGGGGGGGDDETKLKRVEWSASVSATHETRVEASRARPGSRVVLYANKDPSQRSSLVFHGQKRFGLPKDRRDRLLSMHATAACFPHSWVVLSGLGARRRSRSRASGPDRGAFMPSVYTPMRAYRATTTRAYVERSHVHQKLSQYHRDRAERIVAGSSVISMMTAEFRPGLGWYASAMRGQISLASGAPLSP